MTVSYRCKTNAGANNPSQHQKTMGLTMIVNPNTFPISDGRAFYLWTALPGTPFGTAFSDFVESLPCGSTVVVLTNQIPHDSPEWDDLFDALYVTAPSHLYVDVWTTLGRPTSSRRWKPCGCNATHDLFCHVHRYSYE